MGLTERGRKEKYVKRKDWNAVAKEGGIQAIISCTCVSFQLSSWSLPASSLGGCAVCED